MNMTARARIVKIGNSQGVRIPKFLLGQLELGEEVELTVEEGQLVIRPLRRSRHGWDEAFRRMAERRDDRMLDESAVSLTKWDRDEWEWV